MKIICIGRNYVKHIEELKNERPKEPVTFMKPDSAIILKNNPFIIPPFSDDIHYEVEILVKINRIGKFIDQKFAHKYYDELGLGIDFTARDLQEKLRNKGLPWEKAKAFDGSAMIGKFCNKKELNLESIKFQLVKNDDVVQDGDSSHMLWSIDEIIAYVSQFFTLKIGDIIFTGTPAGVGRVEANDVLTGLLEGREMFSLKVK